MFFERLENKEVRCHLCAHNCLIQDGKRGICAVRENTDGVLFSLVYGKVITAHVDPIEKKPLFHMLPSSSSFSIAAVGCNFRCMHCQNYEISQYPRERKFEVPGQEMSPDDIVELAVKQRCESISYTYTEPTIFFEFAYDCARLAHKKGIRNVFVSNGYTGPEAVKTIAPYLTANNIDLKGSDKFYRETCGARLKPVQETIALMRGLGVWVEVTTLIIPGHNDSDEDLSAIARFIHSVDPAIPWHISRFHPTYKLMDAPVTSLEILRKARKIGHAEGLKFVYEGNVPGEDGENTYCPACRELLIKRVGFRIAHNSIKDGKCNKCGNMIEGIWK